MMYRAQTARHHLRAGVFHIWHRNKRMHPVLSHLPEKVFFSFFMNCKSHQCKLICMRRALTSQTHPYPTGRRKVHVLSCSFKPCLHQLNYPMTTTLIGRWDEGNVLFPPNSRRSLDGHVTEWIRFSHLAQRPTS